jgi:ABC-type uncharacterized transport system fused permease/ATPase subunit
MILNSEYKSNLSRTRAYTEPIAFLDGGMKEKMISDSKLNDYDIYTKSLITHRIVPDMIDSYFIKYCGMMTGFMIIVPEIYSGKFRGSSSDISKHYILSANYLTRLGQAIIDIINVQKSLYNLEGAGMRIKEIYEKFKQVKYTNIPFSNENSIIINDLDVDVPNNLDVILSNNLDSPTPDNLNVILQDKENKRCLIKNLNLKITKGSSLVVIGKNGIGKTSLFRILANLWTPQKGEIIIPNKTKILFYC